jgi:hypothetical protein
MFLRDPADRFRREFADVSSTSFMRLLPQMQGMPKFSPRQANGLHLLFERLPAKSI